MTPSHRHLVGKTIQIRREAMSPSSEQIVTFRNQVDFPDD
jgi:hypothetical protein